jgi:hypothetical protein
MWTYLNTPFLLARPDVKSEEIESWQEAGETWRRLRVRFPADIATHSTEQTLYFDEHGLLKRHVLLFLQGLIRVNYPWRKPMNMTPRIKNLTVGCKDQATDA